MIKSVLCVVVALAGVLNAQDLLPELAAPAAQHKAADEALDKQKLEAIALAAKSYVSALDGVEKSATAKGELDLVAAVVKEREAVASGTLEPDLASALPKARLQMSRKTLLASIERINADFAKRQKKADADYLRVLASLQTKAATNPELAKQLAAEKAALLENGRAGAKGGTGSGAGAEKAARGNNVINNGDFEMIADGKPEEWYNTKNVSVESEGQNNFVRFEGVSTNKDDTAQFLTVYQTDIDVPKGAKNVFVSAKLRTKDCIVSKKRIVKSEIYIKPGFSLAFRNQDKKSFSYVVAYWDKRNGPWKTLQQAGPVPKEAVTMTLDLTNGSRAGQIDFDDVEVTFE